MSSGTSIYTWVTDTGLKPQPYDLTKGTIAAWVPKAGGTGFDKYSGIGKADGTFAIPGVPSGPYYLQRNTLFFLTSSRTIALDDKEGGRPDVATATMSLTFNIGGLNPWQSSDIIQYFSVGSDTYFLNLLNSELVDPPAAGTTTLNLNLRIRGHLIDGTRGDRAWATQLVSRTSDKRMPYVALGKAIQTLPTPHPEGDGRCATVQGVLVDVAQSWSANVLWARSQFEAYRSAVSPSATSSSQVVFISAQPGGEGDAGFTSSPDLVIAQAKLDSTDIEFGKLIWGNPFPTEWEPFLCAKDEFRVNVTAPGGSATPITAWISTYGRVDDFNGVPIPVLMSPVIAPKIGGMDAFQTRSGVGTSPTVSWSAPTVGGNSARTQVIAYRLSVVSGATRITYVGTVMTTGTSVTFPPGILEAGQTYVLEILTCGPTQPDVAKHPFRYTLPRGCASTITANFIP